MSLPGLGPLPVIYRGHDQAGFFAHALGLQGGPHPLEVLPGNQPPVAGFYACIVVLNDYLRLRCDYTRQHRLWHYSELEPAIVRDLREGRCLLVFDFSNEGPAYFPELFAPLYAWLAAHDIPAARCVWLAQNRAFAASMRADPAAPRPGLQMLHYDFFVKLAAFLLTAGHAESLLPENIDDYAQALFDPAAKDRLLLCLNATPRLHRVLCLAALHQQGCLDDSLASFPGLDYAKPGSNRADILAYVQAAPALHYVEPSVEAVLAAPPRRVDAFTETGNHLIARVDLAAYQRTYFSLVTESEFSPGDIDRVTEKTLKAFGLGHPVLLASNPDALHYLTDLGFQGWEGLFDQTYDRLADPVERFQALFKEVNRQVVSIRHDAAGWLGRARETGLYNLRHAHGGGLLREAIDKIDRVAVERIRAAL